MPKRKSDSCAKILLAVAALFPCTNNFSGMYISRTTPKIDPTMYRSPAILAFLLSEVMWNLRRKLRGGTATPARKFRFREPKGQPWGPYSLAPTPCYLVYTSAIQSSCLWRGRQQRGRYFFPHSYFCGPPLGCDSAHSRDDCGGRGRPYGHGHYPPGLFSSNGRGGLASAPFWIRATHRGSGRHRHRPGHHRF